MKVSLFQQAPYRFMPAGFETRGEPSVVSLPYEELVDPALLFDSYRWYVEGDARRAESGVRRRRGH